MGQTCQDNQYRPGSEYGLVRHSGLEPDRELLMGDLDQNSGKRILLQCNNYLICVTVILFTKSHTQLQTKV